MTTPLSPVLDCTEFVAAEGTYELLQDIYLDQVLPHPVIPTYVSSVSVKYKDYFNATGNGGNGARLHGKQTSTDNTLSASNLDRLEERLKEFKLKDEKGGDEDDGGRTPGSNGGTLSRNFHGNLVDLPLYNDDSAAGGMKSPRSGMMSPGLPLVMTPGPPPLKDSTSSNRISDPYSQFGPPPPIPQQHQQAQHSFKSLSRANSHYSQGQDDNNGSGQSSSATGSSSAGFSFFGAKRKKPKNNITKTNSTFVAKITTHDNLAKILANRVNEDVYLFWNTGRTFTWSDLGQKPNEPLSHISFTKAFPTTHDVNVLTRSCDHLDVIIGFSTGDIIWFDPLCNKYYRLNKQAIIKDSAVTMIKWMPGSETQFMAAFHDGSVLIMDKERDDNTFSVPTPPDDNIFHVTRPKHGKHNPISHWQVCKKPITAFAFSPDLQHVAVVAMDGSLRIIDIHHERLLDTFSAYFGALNCVCWSPDGKYILTGGQDDLVTIWSFKDQRIIARCQGHQSYVTGVAFDPWRCDERNYRFGSVGEDAKLLLWDFSVGALHKPKAAVMQRRGSNATASGGAGGYKPGHGSKGSISSLRGSSGHSLFSGHHTNKSSTSQTSQSTSVTSPHHLQSGQPAIAEESAQDLAVGGNGEVSLTGSSTRNNNVKDANPNTNSNHSQTRHQPGESALSGDVSSTRSPTHSSAVVQEVDGGRIRATTVTAGEGASAMRGSQDGFDAGSSNGVYKKSAHARTLPHLHLHKSHFSQSDGHDDNNGHLHHDHGHGHVHGLPSLFRHGNGAQTNHQGVQVVRPPEPRSHVAMLQPLMAKGIHQEPLASITFREDAIMTSDRRGHIKVWKRPLPHHP